MASEPELIIRFKGDSKDLDESIKKIKDSLAGLSPATDKATSGNKKFEDSTKSLGSSLANLAKTYLTYQAALSAGKFILDATLQVSKFETQLKTASGGQIEFGKNMSFLEDLSRTYKKNVVDLGSSFAQLTIATKGTNLEGAETEKLFKAVTIASSALKMSTDDTNGTFRAFIQMVSKGNVQAEELRGQLGERLFGAFNIAARAMGKTTAELNGMLERGEVLASDLLPKMSDELLKTFGDDAIEGAKSLGSNIDYATGQLTLFVAELAKTSGASDGVTEIAKDFGDLLSRLRIINQEWGAFAAGLSGVMALIGKAAGGKSNGIVDILTDEQINKRNAAKPVPLGTKFPFPSRDKAGIGGAILSGGLKDNIFGSLPETSEIEKSSTQLTVKQIKAAEKAKKDRERAASKLASEEKKDAEVRIKDQLASQELALTQAYAKYNGTLGAIAEAAPAGISTGYDNALDKTQKFTNELSTGGLDGLIGRVEANMNSYAATIAKFNQITPADWKNGINTKELKEENIRLTEEGERLSSITEELTSDLKQMYGSMAGATEAGWGDIIAKIKAGKLGYEEALNSIAQSNAIKNIEQMTKDLQIDLVSGISESLGAMATGASGLGDLMSNIYSIFGDFLTNLGKQMLVASGVFSGLKVSLSTLSGPVAAVAGALAIAAGAALKSYASNSGKKASSSFYTGGIASGMGGVDNIPINVSPGEMILNKRQQSNLFGILDGAFSGNMMRSNSGYGNNSYSDFGTLETKVRGDELAILVERGKRRLNRYN